MENYDPDEFYFDLPGFSTKETIMLGVLAAIGCVCFPFVWGYSKITGKEIF